ncbi:MAG: molybdenum cofactor biosynthesis protein MoaE [Ignisphaera sp.]
MRIKIKLFSLFKEIFNSDEIEVQFEKNSVTVEELKEALAKISPKARNVLSSVEPIIMVNGIVADANTNIGEVDEVALLPPMSGGSKHVSVKLFVDDRDVDIESRVRDILTKVGGEGVGAIAIFVGVVKDVVDGYKVRELVYEAYEPYATKTLERIAVEESVNENIKAIEIMHRVGAAKPGEKTLCIIVASRNRKEALDTLSRVLERVKHEVPIFKLEKREDGEYYVIGDGKRVKSPSEVS